MMQRKTSVDRRNFLRQSATCAAGAAMVPLLSRVGLAAEPALLPAGKRIYTSVKWGMIEHPGSVRDKFQLCKDLGYTGMELVSPFEGFTIEEINAASEATGMPVHGVVDTKHWDVRLSSPDEAIRAQAVDHVRQAIEDCHAMGGFSVLLVPGRVNGGDESHDDVWARSIVGIRQVLDTASKLGVRVLIENVWNGFCETPEQLRDYIDEIDNPWVGSYFDIGNVQKFSPSEEWIKVLGSRIVKLDVKDWGKSNGFCKIGDGDVNWPAVRQALDDIEFTGWCTAEVQGGGSEELRDIHERMVKVLALV
jgi:hexulose-6-phosphate isomerase